MTTLKVAHYVKAMLFTCYTRCYWPHDWFRILDFLTIIVQTIIKTYVEYLNYFVFDSFTPFILVYILLSFFKLN